MRRDWFTRIAAILAMTMITPVALPVSAETGSAAPAPNDGATTPTQEAEAPAPAITRSAPRRSVAAPPVARGDDSLPTLREATNNPYIGTDSLTGELAFVPPPIIQEEESTLGSGEDLRRVLGDTVYDRRVNIVTPPNTDVEEVVRLLSEQAELNFLYASGTIRGQVTLNLNNVRLGVALESLLATQQLSIVREGDNVMRIAPRVEVRGSAVELRTIYIKLNWVLAEQLDKVLREAMRDSGGTGSQNFTKIVAQKETNTLIITDTPGNVALIRDLVNQLDVPEKQVMIEARMVELLISNERSQGARTTLEREGRDNSIINSTNNALISRAGRNFGVPILGAAGSGINAETRPVDQVLSLLQGNPANPTLSFGGTLGILGKQVAVNTVLDALEIRNIINTLTNPRVITLNNQRAEIDIKREIPYLTTVQGAGGQTSVQPSFKDAGVKLAVTPNITNTGFVKMQLQPEQLILAGFSGTPPVPIIDSRKAVTNVIVKDEDTVVIGGLREINTVRNTEQVPWIGQAPIIGWFFKSNIKSHRKNELMLFVTPRIVKSPVLTPAENYQYSRIDAHWDLPDFFFDDSVDSRERNTSVLNDPAMYQNRSLNLPVPTN